MHRPGVHPVDGPPGPVILGAQVSTRQYTDRRHHPVVLVPEDVTVIDEVAYVGPTKVHPYRNAGVRARTAPERNLVHVIELLLVRSHRHSIDRHQEEMNLMHVKLVIL